MTIFAANARTVYRCAICDRWWQTPIPQVSCTMTHSPGSCCHYGETEMSAPQPIATEDAS